MTPGQHTDHKVTFNCISVLQVDERKAEYGVLDYLMLCEWAVYHETTELQLRKVLHGKKQVCINFNLICFASVKWVCSSTNRHTNL